jgi:hypothetical protein
VSSFGASSSDSAEDDEDGDPILTLAFDQHQFELADGDSLQVSHPTFLFSFSFFHKIIFSS